jgi:hypothetical protein
LASQRRKNSAAFVPLFRPASTAVISDMPCSSMPKRRPAQAGPRSF